MNFKQKLVYTALGGILIFIGLLLSHTFGGDVKAQWQQGDPPANITVSEYLDLLFNSRLAKTSAVELSTGHLLFFPTVHFFHPGDVSQGMVYMVISWADESLSQLELRRGIRAMAYNKTRTFKPMLGWPQVRNRWSPLYPYTRFVIRHVRLSDRQETLAVTLNGETSFDAAEFWEAKRRVESRGGNW